MSYRRYRCRKRGCFCDQDVYLLDIKGRTVPMHCEEYEEAVHAGSIPRYKPR